MMTIRQGSTVSLYLIAILLPIRWLPYLDPSILYYSIRLLLILFLIFEGLNMTKESEYMISSHWVIVCIGIFIVGLISFVRFSYISKFLFVLFMLMLINYTRSKKNVGYIFMVFTVWMTILSLFSLIVTYTPVSGFTLSEPISSGYHNPVSRWPDKPIQINSFGFFGSRGIYTLTSISYVFATVYWMVDKSYKYLIMNAILGSQLLSIIYLTNSGRSGLVLPMFLLIIISFRRLSLTRWTPLIVFSPIIFWVIVYILHLYSDITSILVMLNNFMSDRVALYMDAIAILHNNHQALVGWGLDPWDEYTVSELNVQQSSIGRYGELLTRPHNFLLEFMIQYGLLTGILFLSILSTAVYKISHEIRKTNDPTKLSVAIIVTGIIFVGLSIGGKSGPFSVGTRSNIFWWISVGYIIGDSVEENSLVCHDGIKPN